MSSIDSLQNKVRLSILCIEHLKKIVEEVEKVNEQEIDKSFKEVYEALTHFKTEVGNLRVQVIYNYSHGKSCNNG
jgi:hypothetical protein